MPLNIPLYWATSTYLEFRISHTLPKKTFSPATRHFTSPHWSVCTNLLLQTHNSIHWIRDNFNAKLESTFWARNNTNAIPKNGPNVRSRQNIAPTQSAFEHFQNFLVALLLLGNCNILTCAGVTWWILQADMRASTHALHSPAICTHAYWHLHMGTTENSPVPTNFRPRT